LNKNGDINKYKINLADAGLWTIVFLEILVICVIRYMLGFAKKNNVTSLKNIIDTNLVVYVVIIFYILVTYTFINSRIETLVESLSKYNALISKLDTSYSALSNCLDDTSKNVLTKSIVYNIKHEQHADGNDSDILKNYATELSRYITHKKGNELKDVYVLVK